MKKVSLLLTLALIASSSAYAATGATETLPSGVTVTQIKEENRALRQRQETLASEKTSLLNRNEQVRTRVEAMIGRLKAMEHSA